MFLLKKTLAISIVLYFFECSMPACQYQQQKIFPTDSGYFLIQKLVMAYKPVNVLDYSAARVKMYKEIYNRTDSVDCVYTRHSLYLDPNYSDPIGYLSKNGNDNGINCEHSFPQSKGAENGNAKSDMHHLYPARAAVNEARSNYPFGEIDDNKTSKWFYKSQSQNFIPTKDKDEYSESISGLFEPREDHKGNVARAIFYFFNMYELQADAAFFENMKSTLCSWHLKDPVDSIEYHRTFLIAKYQDQKPNPFVLDCSLARRCYCPTLPECHAITQTENQHATPFRVHPNPCNEQLFVETNVFIRDQEVQLFDMHGILRLKKRFNASGTSKFELNLQEIPSGFYTLTISAEGRLLNKARVLKY